VDIVGIRAARERVSIMERNLGFEQDADSFRNTFMPKEEELSHQIERGRELVGQVTHTSRDLLSIAALTSSLNVDGHRADLVILKAARAQAAFEGRTKINDHDIALAAELALPHRIKRTPFQQAEMTTEQLQERIEQLAGQSVPSEAEADESESQEGKSERKPGPVTPSAERFRAIRGRGVGPRGASEPGTRDELSTRVTSIGRTACRTVERSGWAEGPGPPQLASERRSSRHPFGAPGLPGASSVVT
jgi:Mg-chelatase subunit ChlI